MRVFSVLVACASVSFSAVAMAQSQPAPSNAPAAAPAPELTVGAKVYDSEGVELGTIGSISGGNAVVTIDTYSIALPPTAFAKTEKGLVVGATRAQVIAAAEKAANASAANLAAALQPNAEVRSASGNTVVGKVKSADAEFVTLSTSRGDVRLPRSALVMGASGLAVGMSADQFQTALDQATAGSTNGG